MQAIPAVVAKSGDADAGAILVRVCHGGHSQIYTQTRGLDGQLRWMLATGETPISDEKADSYVEKARQVDADLWVLDIDSPTGQVPFLLDNSPV